MVCGSALRLSGDDTDGADNRLSGRGGEDRLATAGGSDVPAAAADPLARLLEGIPVTERRLGLAGVS
ncbi:MAG: hypothetical protein ACRDG9_13185, partial [Actinomycetota bacterium]